ncbi:hypothetical protein CY34DRAFT_806901 [Suillus luteus UH-Slu-Lm8-n1]|uniref:Uncharacterized protein n=1 Tax=Suillus luteus UH-Slu-Lm8-n1 TaxID=930992 RepID=A0A0C9ZSE3_9AGAM|nr:hypothetical protein CY34DRAFT_806901 [Suillus luteus UH-Slu-Lm8-n1]
MAFIIRYQQQRKAWARYQSDTHPELHIADGIHHGDTLVASRHNVGLFGLGGRSSLGKPRKASPTSSPHTLRHIHGLEAQPMMNSNIPLTTIMALW